MTPTLTRIGQPPPTLPAAESAPDRELLRVVERALAKQSPPAPRVGWRFVPRRDENNLILEIIATPFDL